MVRIREDATYTVQEYRQSENLSGSEMARVLRELATTLELEAQLDDD